AQADERGRCGQAPPSSPPASSCEPGSMLRSRIRRSAPFISSGNSVNGFMASPASAAAPRPFLIRPARKKRGVCYHFPDPVSVVEAAFALQPVTFPAPGEYRVELYAGGQCLAGRSITAVLACGPE